MASTVFQLTLTIIVINMTIAITTIPRSADEIPCNEIPTCKLGKEKFIVKTTVAPSAYYESREATDSTYRMEASNGTAINRLYDETETVTSESTNRAAYCTVKNAADVELGDLLDASEGAMVTLIAGDTRLTAHRSVLAARSPGFAALLCHGTQEAGSGEVAIADVEGPVLRHLVASLYTLRAPQLPSMAPHLLAAADKLGVSALKAECEGQVASQLSAENAAGTAVLAIRHSSTALRQAAIAFMKAHLLQVIGTKGWANAARCHPEDMTEVYRLLTELPLEASTHNVSLGSTPAAAASQTTTAAPSLTQSSQGWTPVAAAPDSQPTAAVSSLLHGSERETPASPDIQPITETPSMPDNTETPSMPDNTHGQTPVATASPSPPTTTPDDADSLLRNLASEEKGDRLRQAAMDGRVEDVEALLAAGAGVGATDGARRTALHYAAREGHVEVARLLLQAGTQVDARDQVQWTPLHFAAHRGHAAVVRLLLASSADPNAKENDNWFTPLHWAASEGHTEAVAALLQAGADKGARHYWGSTPLDFARLFHHQPVIQLLT